MSLHFEPGEYDIYQNERKVGRLVALDSVGSGMLAKEYWYLYYNIPTTSTTFRTYTGPSQNDVFPPPADHFGQAKDVCWTFKYLGQPSTVFDPSNPSAYVS